MQHGEAGRCDEAVMKRWSSRGVQEQVVGGDNPS